MQIKKDTNKWVLKKLKDDSDNGSLVNGDFEIYVERPNIRDKN